MLQTTAPINQNSTKFVTLSEAIQETFKAIDRFEWQACEELREMRDEEIFKEGGYPSFEKYCEENLSQWGGYRRVNQLLAAKRVIDTLKGTEYETAIARESHARPLLKLIKTPEKLRQAVAIAVEHNPQPIAEDFRKAVLTIVPPKEQKSKSQEQLFLNNAQNPDSVVAPKSYSEDEVQKLIAIAIDESRQGIMSELREQAEIDVREQLIAQQAIANQRQQEIAQLHQKIQELENLRRLETENQQLQQRIAELENALDDKLDQQWGNTMSKQAQKVLNTEAQKLVKELPPELHLKVLATSAPKGSVDECLKLMGMALSNLAIAMNNAQVAQAAALLEQVAEPVSEHESLVAEAVEEIRKVLASGCEWNQFKAVVEEFEQIKDHYWKALSNSDRSTIKQLKQSQDELEAFEEIHQIHVGDWVRGSFEYHETFNYRGIVERIKPASEQIFVNWKYGDFRYERYHYGPSELTVIPNPEQEVA